MFKPHLHESLDVYWTRLVTRIRPLVLKPMSTHCLLSYALLAKFVYCISSNQSARPTPHLQAQADVQHLWFGRRAATRIRSQLMAVIYDKALKRKDYSGIVDKEKTKEVSDRDKKRDPKSSAEAEAKANDPKAGANVGKIVNLMAGDANQVAMTSSVMYFLYGSMSLHSPFLWFKSGSSIHSRSIRDHYCMFLPLSVSYRNVYPTHAKICFSLLGWSAFAGFVILLLGWPLNSFLTKRSIRIQKGVTTARDKRMGVLNELISAVSYYSFCDFPATADYCLAKIKFIKFFAWESRWIDRVSDARATEIKWMIKSRINSIMFQLLWSCAPVLVSITSFLVFVLQGKQLTASIAFTVCHFWSTSTKN
jgi:ABC-type multidrug transport system fused ATPase/permease subunit